MLSVLGVAAGDVGQLLCWYSPCLIGHPEKGDEMGPVQTRWHFKVGKPLSGQWWVHLACSETCH